MRLPTDLLDKITRLLHLSEKWSLVALSPISICCRSTNEIARKLEYRAVTVTAYHDLRVYRDIVERAGHLILYVNFTSYRSASA